MVLCSIFSIIASHDYHSAGKETLCDMGKTDHKQNTTKHYKVSVCISVIARATVPVTPKPCEVTANNLKIGHT